MPVLFANHDCTGLPNACQSSIRRVKSAGVSKFSLARTAMAEPFVSVGRYNSNCTRGLFRP